MNKTFRKQMGTHPNGMPRWVSTPSGYSETFPYRPSENDRGDPLLFDDEQAQAYYAVKQLPADTLRSYGVVRYE